MRTVIHLAAIVSILWGTSRGVSAQGRFPASSETPKAEVGLFGGLWNLEPSGPISR